MAPEVNEAVEIAHSKGILSAASLMVAEAASAEAINRARRLPDLRVGLHLVLVDGNPALPVEAIPDLVDADGRLRSDFARIGWAIATRPHVRQQLTAEINAQFEMFHATGLELDHVNTHRHYHLHPIVAPLIIAVGRRFGMRALRVPFEPAAVLARVEPGSRGPMVERALARILRLRAQRSVATVPDAVFGLAWSGALTARRLSELIRHSPSGLVEIYTHPATTESFAGCASGYRYTEELAALCDPSSIDALRCADCSVGGYGK